MESLFKIHCVIENTILVFSDENKICFCFKNDKGWNFHDTRNVTLFGHDAFVRNVRFYEDENGTYIISGASGMVDGSFKTELFSTSFSFNETGISFGKTEKIHLPHDVYQIMDIAIRKDLIVVCTFSGHILLIQNSKIFANFFLPNGNDVPSSVNFIGDAIIIGTLGMRGPFDASTHSTIYVTFDGMFFQEFTIPNDDERDKISRSIFVQNTAENGFYTVLVGKASGILNILTFKLNGESFEMTKTEKRNVSEKVVDNIFMSNGKYFIAIHDNLIEIKI